MRWVFQDTKEILCPLVFFTSLTTERCYLVWRNNWNNNGVLGCCNVEMFKKKGYIEAVHHKVGLPCVVKPFYFLYHGGMASWESSDMMRSPTGQKSRRRNLQITSKSSLVQIHWVHASNILSMQSCLPSPIQQSKRTNIVSTKYMTR
jgi:hypothetical protein